MDDRAALLVSVLKAPADDTARLVLADWLEENGEGEFGRFLRAGVLAAQFQAQDRLDDPAYYDLLRDIAEVTTAGAPARWLAALGVGPSPLTRKDWVWDHAGDRVTVRIGATSGVFTRGLLSELIAPLQGWADAAAAALAVWPLERATIADAPGLSFWIEPTAPDTDRWVLTAAFTAPQPRPRARTLFRRVAVSLFGDGSPPRPAAVGRWTAARAFTDRESLVRQLRDVWPALLDQLRDAAAAGWPPAPHQPT